MPPYRQTGQKTAYEKWKEEKEKRPFTMGSLPMSENNKTRKGSKESSKGYDWEREYLKDVKGRSYNDKFNKLMDAQGIPEKERDGFRMFLDSKENTEPGRQEEIEFFNKLSKPNRNLKEFFPNAKLVSPDEFRRQQDGLYQDSDEKDKLKRWEDRQPSFWDNAKKFGLDALEIIDRPADAVRTGIKGAVEGNGFFGNALDGLLGRQNTSGTDLNRALGFDATGEDKDLASKIGGYALNAGAGPLGSVLAKPFLTDETKAEVPGMATEALLDPLNLVGGGVFKAVKSLKAKGIAKPTISQVAREADIPEQQVQEILSLPAPQTRQVPRGVGREVEIEGIPSLNAPEGIPNNLNQDEILEEMSRLSNDIETKRADFVSQQMKDIDTQMERVKQGEDTWKLLNQSKGRRKEIQDALGKKRIYVDPSINSDWKELIPRNLRSAKPGDGAVDMYQAAEMLGYSSDNVGVERMLDEFQDVYSQVNTRKVDVMPSGDNLNPNQYQEFVDIAHQAFEETDDYKQVDALLADLAEMAKNNEIYGQREFLTDGPLASNEMFNLKEESVYPDFTVRNTNPVATSVNGRYSTRPSNDGIRLDVSEAATTRQSNDPLGVVAGRINTDANRPISSTKSNATNLANRIRSGEKNLKDDATVAKQAYTSDLSVAKSIENAIKSLDFEDTLKKAKDGSLSVGDSLYKGLREAKRAASYAVRDIEQTYQPIIKNLSQKGIDQKDFDDYLLARHAEDILKNNAELGRKRGILENSLADIDEMIDSGKLPPDEVDELEKLKRTQMGQLEDFADYELPEYATPKWVNSTLKRLGNNKDIQKAQADWIKEQQRDLDMLVDAGLYTREAADRMIEAHPNYIPMLRDKGQEVFGTGNIARPKQQMMKRGKGGKEAIKSPIESAFRNRLITYSNIKKNEALQRIEKMAKIKEQDLFKEINPNATNVSDLDTVRFFKNGKEKIYEVPPAFKNMVDNLTQQQDDQVLSEALKGINNLIKKGSTHYNLEFILRSLVRDPQTGIMTSRSGVKPWDYPVAFLDSMFGDKFLKESYKEAFLNRGGKMTGMISVDNQSINRAVRETMEGKFKKGIKAFPRMIEKFGEIAEMTPRLAEYRSAKRAGWSDEDAAFEAIDVMDYSDLGSVTRKANKYIPYIGAAVRGNARLLEALKENPGKFASKGAMYISLPTLGIFAAQQAASPEQKDKLKNLQNFEKNLYWHIPSPNGKDLLVVPKAHVVAQVFANPLERTLEQIFSESDSTVGEDVKTSILDLGKSLIPPTGIAGYQQFVEAATNYNMFMDIPIESGKTGIEKQLKDGSTSLKRMEDVPEEQRYNMFTSELAKLIGGRTGLSPAKVDHVVRGSVGSVGGDVLNGADEVLRLLGQVDRPSRPEGIGALLNPLDTFIRPDERGSGRVNRLRDLAQDNRENGTKDERLDKIISELNDLSLDIAKTRENKRLSPSEKKAQLGRLREEERRLANSYFR